MSALGKNLLFTVFLASISFFDVTSVAAAGETIAGTMTVASVNESLTISAPYVGDGIDGIEKNTLLIEWGLSGDNFNLGSDSLLNNPSPYSYTIDGLSNGTAYQVRVTWQDADNTPNPTQTLTNLKPFNKLVHSSLSTGSAKWGASGWGVSDGKYGEFVCLTCHMRRSPNIKRIKSVLVAPNGIDQLPIEVATSPYNAVIFNSMNEGSSDFGDDVVGHTSSVMICEACHSITNYHRYNTNDPDGDGALSAQSNFGHNNKTDCIKCHKHSSGFAHGKGANGTNCEQCHGHDGGYEYSPGLFSAGTGTSQSHSTHTENDSDDLKGPPNLYTCSSCHDTNNYPYFNTGIDSNGDGKINLAETTICNNCHSPDGAINGVDSINGSVGAKDNWATGVYTLRTFQTGKEAWCLGCHDDVPANTNQAGTGRDAKNMAGDNVTYGFNVNGHGNNSSTTCLHCHSAAKRHFNTTDRFYDGKSVTYRIGWDSNTTPLDDNALCISCHGDGKITDPSDPTNFVTDSGGNLHPFHTSSTTCAWCHDPHGTENPRMTKELHMGTLKVLRWDAGQGKYFELTDPALWDTPANVGYVTATPKYPGCAMCHLIDYTPDGTEPELWPPIFGDFPVLANGVGPGKNGYESRHTWHTRPYIDLSATHTVNFDMDSDGTNDDVDNCYTLENSDQADSDSDGVGNVCDNCPDRRNPDQADSDQNGAGDVCDIPDTPVNNTPVHNATVTTPKPTLVSSAYSDPHPTHSHNASQWQITTVSGNYNAPFYDSVTGISTSHTISQPLNGSTTYYWHVRYRDFQGSWSDYSSETSFTAANLIPNRPTNTSPTHLVNGVSVTPSLVSSSFSDQNPADTHQRSQWQISLTLRDYVSPVYDSGPIADLTSHTLTSDLAGSTKYWWRVRHEDSEGNWSGYSAESSFTTLIRPPDTPANTSPTAGAISQELSVTLTSSPFSDLDVDDTHLASHWQVTTVSGSYSSPKVDSINSNLTSHTINGLNPNVTYYWHVRHQDSAGNWSDFSTETSFTTNQSPNKPVLTSPAHGVRGQSLTPTLSATFSDPDASDTLQEARYFISLTSSDYSPPLYSSTSNSESFTVPTGHLSPSTWYFWFAKHVDSFGNLSSPSVERVFKTTTIPNQPSNISPAHVETILTLTPTLTASNFADPDAGDTHSVSQWQISTNNSDFNSPVYDSGETTDLTSHTIANALEVSTNYFWHVRYKDNNGAWSAYSTATFVRVNSIPATPSAVSPTDNAIDESVAVTFVCSAFSDPDFDVHLASQWQVTTISGDYSSPAYDSGTTTDLTSHTMTVAANNATTYFWRVRHQDEQGEWSAFSSELSFTTIAAGANPPNVPTAGSPSDNATNILITPTLTSSAFSPGEVGNTHAASQWQITTTSGNYITPSYDSAVSTDLTSHVVASALSNSTEYFWHVRHMDNQGMWSTYSSEYSFTTKTAAPQTLTLYPTDLASFNGVWDSPNGPMESIVWPDVLSTNDGDASFVASCCGGPGDSFYVDMDDFPTELNDATIQYIVIFATARYLSWPWPEPPPEPVQATFALHYKTGPIDQMYFWDTMPDNMYFEVGESFDHNSEGLPLEPADVNNLQIGITRFADGPLQLRITEIRAEIQYIP